MTALRALRLCTYFASFAGLASLTMGEHPDWLQGFVVGFGLLAIALIESPERAK